MRNQSVRKRVTVELSGQDLECIREFLATTKGRPIASELTLPALVEMLLQDVAYSVRRPGSWEGANMLQVLQGHGYE